MIPWRHGGCQGIIHAGRTIHLYQVDAPWGAVRPHCRQFASDRPRTRRLAPERRIEAASRPTTPDQMDRHVEASQDQIVLAMQLRQTKK
jgi:hypothetical protein